MVLLLFVIFSVEAKAPPYILHTLNTGMHNFQNSDFAVVFTMFSSAGLS